MDYKTQVSGQITTPPKTNMEPENDGFKMNLLFQGFIFRFHVSFLGCIFPKPE